MFSHYDLQSVCKKCIRKCCNLALGLLWIGQIENVPETDPHLFSLIISPNPLILVLVFPLTHIFYNLFGDTLSAELTALFDLIDQTGVADRKLSEKFRAIEGQQKQTKKRGVSHPRFEQHGTSAIMRDVTIQSSKN